MKDTYGWKDKDWEDFLKRNQELQDLFNLETTGELTTDQFHDRLRGLTQIGKLDETASYIRGASMMNGLLTNGEFDNVGFGEALKGPFGEENVAFLREFEYGKIALQEFTEQSEVSKDTIEKLFNEINIAGVRSLRKFGDATKDVSEIAANLNSGLKSHNETMKQFRGALGGILNSQYNRNSFRKGNRSGNILESIKEQTGFTKEMAKSKKYRDEVLSAIDQQELVDKQTIETYGNGIFTNLQEGLTDYLQNNPITIDNGLQVDISGGGEVNMSMEQVESQLGAYLTEEQQHFIALLKEAGVSAHAKVTLQDDKAEIVWVIDDLGSGSRGGGGGGGGGGKSAAQKLIEELKKEKAITDHRLKMLQFEETKYKNAGELTNVNRLLVQENDLRLELIDEYTEAIDKLKEQMSKTEKGSDDWYALREAILSYEESIAECNNAIADNTRTFMENLQAIRQTRIALEDTVEGEINERIQKQRDMLAGTVSMQDIILEAIRARYQEEWDRQVPAD